MHVRHGAPSMRRFVGVVGPPAVGKSTVTRALTDRYGGRVFRLREFAYEIRSRPGVNQRLFASDDPLGWLPEDTVAQVLRAAFVQGRFPASALVVLENFPGSLAQLRLLASIADRLVASLMLIELTAGDDLLTIRSQAWRVCPTCEPDPRGDPHRPARGSGHEPHRCVGCGGELQLRWGDEPIRFAARLARFRDRIPAIRTDAKSLHLPYHEVDATSDPATSVHRVTAVLAAAEPSADLAVACEHS